MPRVPDALKPIWIAEPSPWPDFPKDTYTAFRGRFHVSGQIDAEIRYIGVTLLAVWLDGKYLGDGPARFPKNQPEFSIVKEIVQNGEHNLLVLVHYAGLATRLLEDLHPFLALSIGSTNGPIPVEWSARRLEGYQSCFRRTIDTLGWAEFCDTRNAPDCQISIEKDDNTWSEPTEAPIDLGNLRPLSTGSVQNLSLPLVPIASGHTAEQYGYENDDPPARFLFRDLAPEPALADGVWRRYDLGRVRLGRPRFVFDLPEGAVVEFGYCDSMRFDRVAPYLGLGGSSCYLDRFIARGGLQEIMPMAPKGMRFMEVHVKADPSKVKFVEEVFVERTYHGEPEGAFECDDPLLNRIWKLGVDTYRACSEDAIVDCPTRERGQWTGDIVNGEMQSAAAAYSDLRLVRRALLHAAWCARDDGLVAGLTPSGPAYITTYAAQWVSGVLWYFQQTGERALLHELLPFAHRNIDALMGNIGCDGFRNGLGWGFVDWGYSADEGPVDMAVNMIVLGAMRAYRRWLECLGESVPDRLLSCEKLLANTSLGYLANRSWKDIGYHRSVLALSEGLVSAERTPECIRAIKEHIQDCFPNNPHAPRLSDPGFQSTRLITPYFANFAMPVLIENGEFDFAINQYRSCWGWVLDQGLTTAPEVFDLRWSHCHAWSTAPTWQLSKYALGLSPAFDEGQDCYRFTWQPSSLSAVSGLLPTPWGKPIRVKWRRTGSAVRFRVQTERRIQILNGPGAGNVDGSSKWAVSGCSKPE